MIDRVLLWAFAAIAAIMGFILYAALLGLWQGVAVAALIFVCFGFIVNLIPEGEVKRGYL